MKNNPFSDINKNEKQSIRKTLLMQLKLMVIKQQSTTHLM
uniref:Uncharacterized protein n=1 Tax=Vibrio tasmaniensis TaxID=212663 RepID=A0A0H3ZS99_9VIBR|nr:hypothetical protein [Vibrio tasmaniensis]